MAVTRQITEDITWVGGSDRRLALFENIFPLEHGVTYNSYLINDTKTALIDTVDDSVTREFLENVRQALDGRPLDYLVINHMEPDHCSQIDTIRLLYPDVKLVGNNKTFQFIRQFYDIDLGDSCVQVKEGDCLNLGKHTLQFLFAPMVHWPEVMFAYEEHTGILFSADAFGTFGAFQGSIFSDEDDYQEIYLEEARRYYTNIVGKYGSQVQAAMKKASTLDIQMICPLHGPVLRGEEIPFLLGKYAKWSCYEPEEKGVLIAYASMYGNTKNVAELFAAKLVEAGVRPVRVYDVSKTHYSYIVAQAFRLSHWVFASPTYNMGLYAPMETLLRDLQALNLRNRDVALISNGTWAPAAGKIMTELLGCMKDIRLVGDVLDIRSTLKQDQLPQLEALVQAMLESGLGMLST